VPDILSVFKEHQSVIATLDSLIPALEKSVEIITRSLKSNGTVFWMGNGGSAAEAQHMAAELIGRFKKERAALASIALSTDSSILTCLSNDYNFDIVFSRQLEALCKPQDIVIGLSTSGNSKNILQGIETAKRKGAYTIGFTGHEGGKLKEIADSCFVVPSTNTARIQEAHQLLCHTLCECVEELCSK
jgi:D-sedoheptulose 7-phosphate isomerase